MSKFQWNLKLRSCTTYLPPLIYVHTIYNRSRRLNGAALSISINAGFYLSLSICLSLSINLHRWLSLHEPLIFESLITWIFSHNSLTCIRTNDIYYIYIILYVFWTGDTYLVPPDIFWCIWYIKCPCVYRKKHILNTCVYDIMSYRQLRFMMIATIWFIYVILTLGYKLIVVLNNVIATVIYNIFVQDYK